MNISLDIKNDFDKIKNQNPTSLQNKCPGYIPQDEKGN